MYCNNGYAGLSMHRWDIWKSYRFFFDSSRFFVVLTRNLFLLLRTMRRNMKSSAWIRSKDKKSLFSHFYSITNIFIVVSCYCYKLLVRIYTLIFVGFITFALLAYALRFINKVPLSMPNIVQLRTSNNSGRIYYNRVLCCLGSIFVICFRYKVFIKSQNIYGFVKFCWNSYHHFV